MAMVLAVLAGCGSQPTTAPPPPVQSAAPAAAPPPVAAAGRLPAPAAVRNWNDLRMQAARRMMAANPGIVYEGAVPDPLLAIPVLEIELNADGSVRHIDVMRVPRQAKDTVQIAIDAVRRAAPFGDVSRLPKPWKFSETFLFNDDRKFKPRTLDL
ncbi:MAG: hypothetical protein AD742_15975 [Methylibium sp. NZG]|nr:MAG: hypothetical protein AD742_15975 [Methylibium sp. NZG]